MLQSMDHKESDTTELQKNNNLYGTALTTFYTLTFNPPAHRKSRDEQVCSYAGEEIEAKRCKSFAQDW